MDKNIMFEKGMDIGQWFAGLYRRLEQEKQNSWSFCIEICGCIIELRFCSRKESEIAAAYLTGQIVQKEREKDAFFHFWMDDYTKYFDVKDTLKPWIFKDEDGYIQLLPGRYFMGANWKENSFYYCRQLSLASDVPYRVIPLLQLWSRGQDMRVMHGAVVGINGKGVLITAHGGGGKSTLSVSCLLAGMDFVSDDCFLINNHGLLHAMPVETVVKLNTDSMERLNPPMPVIWNDICRNGKKTMDASGYRFCRELSIEAVISAKIVDCEEPQITVAESVPVLMQLVHSTLAQAVVSDYAKESHAVFTRFFGLPTYEIQLSKDFKKNVKLLQSFIEGRL